LVFCALQKGWSYRRVNGSLGANAEADGLRRSLIGRSEPDDQRPMAFGRFGRRIVGLLGFGACAINSDLAERRLEQRLLREIPEVADGPGSDVGNIGVSNLRDAVRASAQLEAVVSRWPHSYQEVRGTDACYSVPEEPWFFGMMRDGGLPVLGATKHRANQERR
jgi:hypothetical protein